MEGGEKGAFFLSCVFLGECFCTFCRGYVCLFFLYATRKKCHCRMQIPDEAFVLWDAKGGMGRGIGLGHENKGQLDESFSVCFVVFYCIFFLLLHHFLRGRWFFVVFVLFVAWKNADSRKFFVGTPQDSEVNVNKKEAVYTNFSRISFFRSFPTFVPPVRVCVCVCLPQQKRRRFGGGAGRGAESRIEITGVSSASGEQRKHNQQHSGPVTGLE